MIVILFIFGSMLLQTKGVEPRMREQVVSECKTDSTIFFRTKVFATPRRYSRLLPDGPFFDVEAFVEVHDPLTSVEFRNLLKNSGLKFVQRPAKSQLAILNFATLEEYGLPFHPLVSSRELKDIIEKYQTSINSLCKDELAKISSYSALRSFLKRNRKFTGPLIFSLEIFVASRYMKTVDLRAEYEPLINSYTLNEEVIKSSLPEFILASLS